MLKRGMIWALALILLLGALPVISLILAVLLASAFGGGLDEGSISGHHGPHRYATIAAGVGSGGGRH
jgi:hypothetical protein